MRLRKILIDNIIKGAGMAICPYPNYEQLSLNKQKRHNQLKRWISSESKQFYLEQDNKKLHHNYYKPSPTESLALRDDWMRVGNALRKAYEFETKTKEKKIMTKNGR